jgi:hypothetical protein
MKIRHNDPNIRNRIGFVVDYKEPLTDVIKQYPMFRYWSKGDNIKQFERDLMEKY